MQNRRHALTQAVRMLRDKPGTSTMDVLTLADYFARWMDRAPGAPCTTCEGADETSTPSTDERCMACGALVLHRGDGCVWLPCTECEGTGRAQRAQTSPQSTSEDMECMACGGEGGGGTMDPDVWIPCSACEGNGRTGGRP